jgi:formate dehydrogenase iron-sulfur subunit
MKCTLCYDRLQGGLTPACAQACPTASIQFGPLSDLRARGAKRVQELHARGESRAYLYGVEGDGYTDQIGGLNSFFLLVDKPEVYHLPPRPTLPSKSTVPDWLAGWGSALVAGVVGLLAFRQQRMAAIDAAPPSDGDRAPIPPSARPVRPASSPAAPASPAPTLVRPPARRAPEHATPGDSGEA